MTIRAVALRGRRKLTVGQGLHFLPPGGGEMSNVASSTEESLPSGNDLSGEVGWSVDRQPLLQAP
jgi:hypothetical protein